MLAAEKNEVRPALAGVEGERQREPRRRAYCVRLFKFSDFVERPGVVAIGSDRAVFDLARRVTRYQIVVDSVRKKRAERLEQVVRGRRPISHGVQALPNVFGLQTIKGLLAVVLVQAEPIKDAAPSLLCPRIEMLECGGLVVVDTEPTDRLPGQILLRNGCLQFSRDGRPCRPSKIRRTQPDQEAEPLAALFA